MLRRVVVVLYLVALAASTAYRWTRPPIAPDLGFNERVMLLPEYAGDARTDRTIRLAYYDYVPPARPDAPVVVLLHGSPGSAGGFASILPQLTGNCPPPGTLGGGLTRRPTVCPAPGPSAPVRVIAPYLPGYGHSENTIADYSFRAHAYYLRDMLDALGVKRAHIVGYSMGGGPAFNLEDIDPQKVASITLLSSLGVQEFELTGDYHLNRIVHFAQVAPLWMIENLIPDFGSLREVPGVEYALNFFQSDQRPLRPWMMRYEKPLLIIQGLQDDQVPPEAAMEHHRIVPHAELVTFVDGDHGMVFRTPEQLAPPILNFVSRVESGTAPTRAQAAPERVAAAFAQPKLAPMIGIALFAFYALVALAAALRPELGASVAGAFLAAGRAPLIGAWLACAAGIVLGDLIVRGRARRAANRHGIDATLRWPWRLVASRSAADIAVRAFQRGAVAGVLRRFVHGSRSAAYLGGATVLRGWRAWLAQTAALVAGGLLWAPLAIGVALVIAWPFARIFPLAPSAQVLAAAVVMLAIGAVLRALTTRSRRAPSM
jgi:pimeloyl-ACP methyl ester carboxylesterase